MKGHMRQRWMNRKLWLTTVAAATTGLVALAWLVWPNVAALWQGIALGGIEARSFEFVAADGRPVARSHLRGRPVAWIFGFTRCGSRCESLLQRADELLMALGPSADDIAVVFATIDPDNDTPAELQRYLSPHSPRLLALITSRQTLESMATHFRVAYSGEPLVRSFSNFADMTRIFLTSRDGRLVDAIDMSESIETGVVEVRKAL